MAIVYTLGRGLYVNMTNRCTCNCTFCLRSKIDHVGSAETLWLEHEPVKEKILTDILEYDLTEFEEIVFCGYGEPTCRLDDMLWVCKRLKKYTNLPLRINTNRHASILAGRGCCSVIQRAF
ncbi:radical SAM protein [Desulfitobacterium hafniense]|nr:radical SAM protein [Desulfitobacterium hafniense]